MVVTQLALILLAAPAATAGAICQDKARGTLAHVMVTDRRTLATSVLPIG